MLTFLNGKKRVDLNYANKLKQIDKIIKEKKKRKKNTDNKGEHFHFFFLTCRILLLHLTLVIAKFIIKKTLGLQFYHL